MPLFLAILNTWLWDRKAETVDALGNVTTATFDAAGNQLSLRDPNSIGWNATYDARNQQITMADTQEQAEGKNRQTAYTATWSARRMPRGNRPVRRLNGFMPGRQRGQA